MACRGLVLLGIRRWTAGDYIIDSMDSTGRLSSTLHSLKSCTPVGLRDAVPDTVEAMVANGRLVRVKKDVFRLVVS